MLHLRIHPRLLVALTALALVAQHSALAEDANPTLATHGSSKITRADFEADMLRIPERDRFGFAMSQERIAKEVDALLRFRVLAEAAKKQGIADDPTFKTRMALLEERLLTEMLLAKTDTASAKDFEAKRATYLERAREQYLVNKQTYMTPPQVRVQHLLVTTNNRTPDEALAKIKALRERIVAGAPFEDVALANSEDPTVRSNKGDVGFFAKGGRMDPAFENAAFELQTKGELSQPVKTSFGYHLIRLEDRKDARQMTFDEVSFDLMEKLKAEYLEQRRTQAMQAAFDPAKVEWNEPAVAGLRKHVDPSVMKGLSQ